MELTNREAIGEKSIGRVAERADDEAERSLVGVMIVQRGRIKHANQTAAQILGYSVARMRSWSPEQLLALVHPEDRPFAEERARKRAAGGAGAVEQYAYRVKTASGETKWIEQYASVIEYQGAPATLILALDLTERRQAEEALQRSEQLYRILVETIPDALIMTDPEGRITFASPQALALGGFEHAEELVGKPGTDFVAPDERGEITEGIRKRIESGGIRRKPARLLRRDGTDISTEISSAVVKDEKGQVQAIVVIASDLSEKRQLEEQLRHARKMDAIGTLAGGVAHDFNNLLTPILGYADILETQAVRGSRVYEAATLIKSAALRASELAGQLLGFARRGKTITASVDLHRIVYDTAALLERTIDRRITISLRLEADTALLNGDPGQLELMVMNLAVNARDAMPGGGELELRTRNVDLGEAACSARLELTPGRYVVLRVRDTGAGMSEQVAQRVFEPFFTTRPEGQGTGMGLAMVYGIVKNHGGAVSVQSEVGKGTTFELFLPADEGVAAVDGSEPERQSIYGRGLVLVVDDEEPVRQVVSSMLTELGYSVVTAGNGQEGIEIFRKRRSEIDLVILDVTMPVLDGVACFGELRQIDPEVRVVVSTGHAVDRAAQLLLDRGARGFVQKPFVKSDLSQALAKALSDAAQPQR